MGCGADAAGARRRSRGTDDYSQTLLFCSVANSHGDVVQILRDGGADESDLERFYNSPLVHA